MKPGTFFVTRFCVLTAFLALVVRSMQTTDFEPCLTEQLSTSLERKCVKNRRLYTVVFLQHKSWDLCDLNFERFNL